MSTGCKLGEGTQGIKSHSKAFKVLFLQQKPTLSLFVQTQAVFNDHSHRARKRVYNKTYTIGRIAVPVKEWLSRGTGQHNGMEVKPQVQC